MKEVQNIAITYEHMVVLSAHKSSENRFSSFQRFFNFYFLCFTFIFLMSTSIVLGTYPTSIACNLTFLLVAI